MGFPGGSDACNAGDLGSVPGLGRFPGGGNGNPLQYSCLESPQGQRSLASYSPWGRKELDTTEQLSTYIRIGTQRVRHYLVTQPPPPHTRGHAHTHTRIYI